MTILVRQMTTPDHYHCPHGHEHPQAFDDAGKLWCGWCWFKRGWRTEMVPCTPDVCDRADDTPARPFRGITFGQWLDRIHALDPAAALEHAIWLPRFMAQETPEQAVRRGGDGR
jgi:hypothetical protein